MKEKSPRGIRCDRCGGTRWKVRRTENLTNGATARRRECLCCGGRVTTVERAAKR